MGNVLFWFELAGNTEKLLLTGAGLRALGLVELGFGKLLHELHVPQPRHDATFRASAGALLYFLGKLLVGLFSNDALLHYSRELNQWMWLVHAALLNVLYDCYDIALGLRSREAPNRFAGI